MLLRACEFTCHKMMQTIANGQPVVATTTSAQFFSSHGGASLTLLQDWDRALSSLHSLQTGVMSEACINSLEVQMDMRLPMLHILLNILKLGIIGITVQFQKGPGEKPRSVWMAHIKSGHENATAQTSSLKKTISSLYMIRHCLHIVVI